MQGLDINKAIDYSWRFAMGKGAKTAQMSFSEFRKAITLLSGTMPHSDAQIRELFKGIHTKGVVTYARYAEFIRKDFSGYIHIDPGKLAAVATQSFQSAVSVEGSVGPQASKYQQTLNNAVNTYNASWASGTERLTLQSLVRTAGPAPVNFDPLEDVWESSLTAKNIQPRSAVLAFSSQILFPQHWGTKELLERYEHVKELGGGSFGKVYCIREKSRNAYLACKIIDFRNTGHAMLDDEIKALKKLDHPNILKLHEIFTDQNYTYLITALCRGPTLNDKLNRWRGDYTEEQVASWMLQVLSATAHCHERGVIHRDLKLDNIMFDEPGPDGGITIIDWGLSSTLERIQANQIEHQVKKPKLAFLTKMFPHVSAFYERRSEIHMAPCGTLAYMAPEMVEGRYNEKCDLFSIGIILYQLLSGHHPFYQNGDQAEELKKKLVSQKPKFNEPSWQRISPEAKDLTQRLLGKNYTLRPSAAEACRHPWFKIMKPKIDQKIFDSVLDRGVVQNLQDYTRNNGLRQAALRCMAKDCTKQQLRDLNQHFRQLDRNNDGTISLEDLSRCLKTEMPSEDLEEVFKAYDVAGNGKQRIGYHQFLSALFAKRYDLQEEAVRRVFNKLDRRGVGKILPQDLASIFTGLDSAEMMQIFQEADLNHDGVIDYEDFHALMYLTGAAAN